MDGMMNFIKYSIILSLSLASLTYCLVTVSTVRKVPWVAYVGRVAYVQCAANGKVKRTSVMDQ